MKNHVIIFSLLLIVHLHSLFAQRQVYIVYVGEHSGQKTLHEIEDRHHSYLLSVKNSKEEAKASLIYSYKNVINGFSALLTPDEASKLSEMDEVVSVFQSHPRRYSLQTTRSWDFVNLLEGGGHSSSNYSDITEELLRKANYGKEVIVGLLDSGVWPESQSFSDEGMEPIPESWKGICQDGAAFNLSHCNRKIIGARYYLKGYEAFYGPLNNTEDYRSPRDKDGHGTHTASTLGGRRVPNTSLPGGFANGTASGGIPMTRIAIYKVCWPIPGPEKAYGNTCFGEDMLAAFDDAIGDGVDVLSVSIVPFDLNPYTEDGIAIGALHAAKHNIVVACSAGNIGPEPSSVRNVAPWMITVGASSVDRAFSSPIVLGNGIQIEGQTITPFNLEGFYPLIYAGDVEVQGATMNDTTGGCLPNTLSPMLTKGKIVLCLRGNTTDEEKSLEVKRAGGFGVIIENSMDGIGTTVDALLLPGTVVFSGDIIKILNYINTTNPMARIAPVRTILNDKPAPVMAAFSSTGPNGLQPNLLKPDITAPGLNILAAWSGANSPSKLSQDQRVVKYNILSGTSMSCPHVAAAATLVKAIHPDWSSAAIRSAIMTTAGQDNNMGNPITDAFGNFATPFNYGSGHFQPAKAADPGLVYDAVYEDYLLFLCSMGVNKIDPLFNCPQNLPSPSNLNYPSLAIAKLNDTIIVNRTVTNVGGPTCVYNLTMEEPNGYSIKISPTTLEFSQLGEKKSFTITVKEEMENRSEKDGYGFGWYVWSDGIHFVRSPIVVSSA